jgi:hypothetical protein
MPTPEHKHPSDDPGNEQKPAEPVLTHRPPRRGRDDRVDGTPDRVHNPDRPPPAPRGEVARDPPDAEDVH